LYYELDLDEFTRAVPLGRNMTFEDIDIYRGFSNVQETKLQYGI
jgi:hypothetical protein